MDFNLLVIYIKVTKYWYYGDNGNDNWKPLNECITPPTSQVSWLIDQIHRVPYTLRASSDGKVCSRQPKGKATRNPLFIVFYEIFQIRLGGLD